MNISSTIWQCPLPEQLLWVEKFKAIFINGARDNIDMIFDHNNFWQHNGFSLEQYCDYEFDEFALKCDKFSLTMDASIECYRLKDNFFYFSLGKKDDKAVFEAIFRWNTDTQLAIGNGYYFKIEPKTQFIKYLSGQEETLRRINITPKDSMLINAIVQKEPGDDLVFNKIKLLPHLGGTFYNIQYCRANEDNTSFWDDLKIATNQGIINQTTLMRGKDHPLFIPDLFPVLNKSLTGITIAEGIFPVVLYVLFEDGEELYFKYPTHHQWLFNKPVSSVCLTDTLSFDWIIKS